MNIFTIGSKCRVCKQPAIVVDATHGGKYCEVHFVEQQESDNPVTYFRSLP